MSSSAEPIPCDSNSLLSSSPNGSTSSHVEAKYRTFNSTTPNCVKNTENFDGCVVCFEPDFDDPCFLSCKHVFCRRCCHRLYDGFVISCPICSTELFLDSREEIEKLPRFRTRKPKKIEPSSKAAQFLLPDEIWVYIFSYCSTSDLLQISKVCKLWRYLSASQSLWREFYLREFSGDEKALQTVKALQTSKHASQISSPEKERKNLVEEDFEFLVNYTPLPRQEGEDWKHFYFRNMRKKYPERFSCNTELEFVVQSHEKKQVQQKMGKTLGVGLGLYYFLLHSIVAAMGYWTLVDGWSFPSICHDLLPFFGGVGIYCSACIIAFAAVAVDYLIRRSGKPPTQIGQCLILSLMLGELILCIIGSIWSWSPRYETCYSNSSNTQYRVEILTISLWVMFGSPMVVLLICTGVLEDWYQMRQKANDSSSSSSATNPLLINN